MAACCLMIAGSIGINSNAAGIFYAPVSEALGVGQGAFAMQTTLGGLAMGFVSPLVFKLLLTVNTKVLVIVGGVVTAVTTALMGVSDNLIQFYILGIIRGLAASLFAMVPVNVLLNNWFEKRHGLITGIVFSFSGIAGVVFNTVLGNVIEGSGWQAAYFIVAIVILVMAVPAGIVINYRPENMGLLPYGRTEPRTSAETSSTMPQIDSKKELKSMSFILVAAFAFLATILTGFGQFFPSFAENIGASLSFGATLLSFAMIGNIAFKFVIGILCDKFGAITGSSIMVGTSVCALGVLVFTKPQGEAAYLFAAALFYGTIYSIGSVGISLVSRYVFGTEKYGYMYGYVSIVLSIGGAIPFTLIGFSYDIFHTFTVAIIGCMIIGTVSIILLQAIRARKALEKKKLASE